MVSVIGSQGRSAVDGLSPIPPFDLAVRSGRAVSRKRVADGQWLCSLRVAAKTNTSRETSRPGSALVTGVDAADHPSHQRLGHHVDEVGVIGQRAAPLSGKSIDGIPPAGWHRIGHPEAQLRDLEGVWGQVPSEAGKTT